MPGEKAGFSFGALLRHLNWAYAPHCEGIGQNCWPMRADK